MTNQMDDQSAVSEPDDTPALIRQFLKAALSPEDLARLTQLINSRQQIIDEHDTAEGGLSFAEKRQAGAMQGHLAQCLTPEQLQYLETLIGHLDSGRDPDEHNDAFQNMVDGAKRRREEAKGNTMYAHDEASDLRSRLRAAGCPVGPYGSLAQLQMLWSHQVASRGRAARRAPTMAGDSARRRPPLPAHLSFDALYPGLRARVGDGSDVFAVPSVEQRRGGGHHAGMAYDARAGGASDTASFDRMYPGLRDRIQAG